MPETTEGMHSLRRTHHWIEQLKKQDTLQKLVSTIKIKTNCRAFITSDSSDLLTTRASRDKATWGGHMTIMLQGCMLLGKGRACNLICHSDQQ